MLLLLFRPTASAFLHINDSIRILQIAGRNRPRW
jgi:hypothetical protein